MSLARRRAGSAPRREAGFTLMELLLAAALFGMLGIALVTLLAQGMNVFTSGTEDTSLQDRFQAIWPVLRDDLSAVHPGSPSGVPPPPIDATETTGGTARPRGLGTAVAEPAAPDVRLRSGFVRLVDAPSERPASAYVAAWVRTNAREAEDPLLQATGVSASATELRSFDPAAVDSGVVGNLLPTGGLLEVAYVAVHAPATAADGPAAAPGVLTLFRCFRAPVGGKGSLLDPDSLDSLAEIRAAGRPVAEGVLHFSITWRNVFAPGWDAGGAAARLEDGQPYVGLVWDSTRGDERMKDFPFHRGKDSLADARDDVFPAAARVDLTLAAPSPFGWRAETTLARPAGTEETRVFLVDAEPLLGPGPVERWMKVGEEWMLANVSSVNLVSREVVVARGRRTTRAAEHPDATAVHVGSSGSAEVLLHARDRYVRRR